MNGSLAFRKVGNSGGPPLVLLHAITASAEMWAMQIAVWSRHFEVIAIDLPGHGESPPAAASRPDIGVYADAVAATLADLGVTSAHFVGLSLGSMTVQRIAATCPDLVKAAVLSSGIFTTPEPARKIWQDRIDQAQQGGIAAAIEPTLERWFTEAFRAASPLTMDWVGTMIGGSSLPGFTFACEAIAALDHSDLLGSITCPALVLAGEHDHVAAPPGVLATMASMIPGGRYAALPGAHLTNIECPSAYTELVGDFLLETM